MNRTWTDFKSLHSNISGAREAFEDSCETLYRKIHLGQHVSQVKVKKGDGGIDIFIGEFGIEPITVIQCKFFLESFDKSQQSQIRESFETAATSTTFELKEWILCIPRIIDIEENSWWFKWKHKQLSQYSKPKEFIKLTNGNELIDLFKKHELYNQIFKIDDSRKLNEIHQVLCPPKINIPVDTSPQIILFNNYSKKCEPFYLERTLDIEFISHLQYNNLWIYGNSGLGKTALINRNLTNNNIEYCYCDLSPITITCSDDVLDEILFKIEEKFSIERNNEEKNKIKQIVQILCISCKKEIVIVIDELSISDNTLFKKTSNDLISLVTFFSNSFEAGTLKFIISTINDPKSMIENKSKASSHFQYLNCNGWSDIDKLFDILNQSLNLNLSNELKIDIINHSEQSPRTLKSIFRKIISLNSSSSDTVKSAITLTISEIVN
jgi:hypothetical protein